MKNGLNALSDKGRASLSSLTAGFAAMQHGLADSADNGAKRQHIRSTLSRCLPARLITDVVVEDWLAAVRENPVCCDPMHTGAIHGFAAKMLLHPPENAGPLLQKLHHSALKLLPVDRDATREDLRLITMDALYQPGRLPGESAILTWLYSQTGGTP